MNAEIFIPITLFVCLAYSLKVVVDARSRRKIIESRGSEELVRSLLEGEAARRRLSSLHWGSVLVALGLGFGAVDLLHVDGVTPAVIAILLVTTGVGNLAYYLIERRAK